MQTTIDLSGQRFGRLRVLRQAPKQGNKTGIYWECVCDCNPEAIAIVGQVGLLRTGTKSCGCLLRENGGRNKKQLAGLRFGRLTVLEQAPVKHKNNRAMWRAKCDCGGEIVTSTQCLTRGNTRSCGCLLVERKTTVAALELIHSMRVDEVLIPTLTSGLRSDNKTGTRGVVAAERKKGTVYIARLTINGKTRHLGTFDTLEEAVAARKEAEEKYFQPYLDRFEATKNNKKDGTNGKEE